MFESLNFEMFVFGSEQGVFFCFRLDGDLILGEWKPFAAEFIIMAGVLVVDEDPGVESCEQSAFQAFFWLSVGSLPAQMSARYSVSESTEDSPIFQFLWVCIPFSTRRELNTSSQNNWVSICNRNLAGCFCLQSE